MACYGFIRGNYGKCQPFPACLSEVILKFYDAMDVELVANACWSLAHLVEYDFDETMDGNQTLQLIAEYEVIPILMQLLHNETDLGILKALIRCSGHLLSSCNEVSHLITGSIIEHGILSAFHHLLSSEFHHGFQKEICFIISNICCEEAKYVELVIESGLVPKLVNIALAEPGNYKVAKQAVWCMLNILDGGNQQHAQYLVEQGALRALNVALRVSVQQGDSFSFAVLRGLRVIASFGYGVVINESGADGMHVADDQV
eukprot:CAMPEP_0197050670 /NCGR_PEP_ID=MMETSP1384-20130603/25518_1 /TAXON_ID=29189 /ORGANISM="Ammonia sp." /LENGTH=258 /DNA_ID=CAMNT_0042483113 /DNA_START=192 /DNA_END=968 /DNA_ORIENTATION=-